ncbi:hypothetical protein C8R43DRAFT_955536 [Mycena crocata]|nr:hypothetical protein C8R43DRAFT_955536 [Mycena crocata]
MTSFAVSSGTASVPGATPSSDTIVAALQLLNAAVASLTAATQPAPVVPATAAAAQVPDALQMLKAALDALTQGSPTPATAPAPPPVQQGGFLTHGPWVVGSLYVVVPTGPLLPIGHEPDGDEEALWYCITKGHVVGVHLSHALALASVTGVSNSAMKAYKTQALAVAAFNELLQYRLVALPSRPLMTTHAPDSETEDADNATLVGLLGALAIRDPERPETSRPPHTPRTTPSPPPSVAGSATQGAPRSHVHVVHHSTPTRKKHVKKAAYVIYRGINIGVRLTWSETKPLVSGVSNCIFHGYASVAEAQAAFSYAQVRSWMRVIGSARAAAIPIADLPQPLLENPLTWSETLDDTWYIVYAGILPGVYRSHLECQLNTLGISGALHESIIDQAAAFAKFAAAAGTVRYLPPTYYVDYSDPFL